MKLSASQIIPITEARTKLGDLTDQLNGEDYIILTKGGSAKAALVDINYLEKLQEEIAKLYQKTFIDLKLLPYTREFSDEEIQTWLKEDQL